MAGRVLSKANESKLRDALQALTDVLALLDKEEAQSEEAREALKALAEAATLGASLEARMHTGFVMAVDELFANGRVTRDERMALLGAVEMALQTFADNVSEVVPDVYTRAPWAEPSETADLGEAGVVESDVVPLIERAVRADGTARIRIIAPGWGASGYYPAEVLERDGPRIFTAGTKQFWNHATPTEDAERPEGDLNALAAELITDARWEPNNPAGPGLYADTKVFAPYQEAINELAPHIGVSIRALGRATQGEAEGRKGPIIQALTAARSVDYVTTPGANGRIVEIFESVGRRSHGAVGMQAAQESEMAEQAMQEALKRAQEEIARMREALILRDARDFVRERLSTANVPDVTRVRLAESLAQNPPVKEHALDREALAQRIEAAVKAEAEYLGQVAGAGRIVGMGAGPQEAPPAEGDTQRRMEESFRLMGLGEKAAKVAAAGRGF